MGSIVSAAMRTAMVALAAVVASIGLALIFAPLLLQFLSPPAWLTRTLCIVGSGLLAGGIFAGYHALYGPGVSLSSFCKEFMKGAILGIVSATCSLIAMEATDWLTETFGLPRIVVSMALGGLCGLVINGASNLIRSRGFFDGWIMALFSGAAVSLVSHGLRYAFSGGATETMSMQTRLFFLLEVTVRTAVAAVGWEGLFNASRDFWTGLMTRQACPAEQPLVEERHRQPRPQMAGNGPVRQRRPVADPRGFAAGASHRSPSPPYGTPPNELAVELPDLARMPVECLHQGPATQPIEILQQEQAEEELPDPSPENAVQENSSDSHDPHSSGGIYADISIGEKAVKKEIVNAHQDILYADNRFLGNLPELLTLHQNQANISSGIQVPVNLMYATTSGGTRLGGGQASQGPSSFDQNNIPDSQYTNADREEHPSNPFGDLKPFKQQAIADSNKKKIATVHRLIAPDERCNYTLTDIIREWPEYNGEMRLVGLMGAPESGKTTLAQAILFQLGYTISEAQATMTRLPIGIHAYVLHDDKLIIVECCEGIDPKDKSLSHSPYGALLLELFMYLFCMRIIYTVPYPSATWEKTKEMKDYIKGRLSLLMAGAGALKVLRSQEFAFVMRVLQSPEDYETNLAQLRNFFTKEQFSTDDQDNVLEPTEEQKQLNNIQKHNKVTVNPLRKFELNDSPAEMKEYNRQLENIINIIMKSASQNGAGNPDLNRNDRPIDSLRFYKSMQLIWEKLTSSKCLKETLANVRAEEVEIKGASHEVKEFLDSGKAFVKKAQNRYPKIGNDYDNYIKEMNQKGEEFEREQTPEVFIAAVVKLANIILRHSINITNKELKEEGIRIGLDGFAVLVRAGNNTMVEAMTLRMAFFECDLMDMLKRPEIYNFYPTCWFLLARLARSGFRLPVLDFDVWTAASGFLHKESLEKEYEVKIYLEILRLLEELTHADPARCVPDIVRHIDVFYSNKIKMESIALEFEKKTKDETSGMLREVLSGLSTAKSVYIRWFKLPKTWFDESGYATMVFDSKEQKKEKLMGISMSRHFEILYRLIAETFSKKIVEKSQIFTTRKFEKRNEEIERIRLLLWNNIADNGKQDKDLFCSVLQSKLPDFLIEEYIAKQEISPQFPQALNTLGALIGAEKCYKTNEDVQTIINAKCVSPQERSGSNVYSLTEVLDRDKIYQLTQRWTWTRLRCLENGIVGKLVPYFLREMHLPRVQYLLSALVTFLAKGENPKEKKISESLYLSNLHALLRRVAAEMTDSVEKLNKMMRTNQEMNEWNNEYQTKMAVLRTGCQFINLILAVFYREELRKKRVLDDTGETFEILVVAARSLYPICMAPSSGSEKQKFDELKRHYLCLVLNLASVSQKSVGDVLKGHQITNIVQLDSMAGPICITCETDEFLDLKIDTEYREHHKLIVVGADLLTGSSNNSFGSTQRTLTSEIKELREQLAISKAEKENYQQWLCEEDDRRKTRNGEANKETRIELTSVPVIASLSTPVAYIIEDVPYCSSHFGHRWPRKPSIEDIRQARGEGVHEAVVDVYILLLRNDINLKMTAFEELLIFFRALSSSSKKPFKIKKDNNCVAQMFQFLHFEEILLKCGYVLEVDHYIVDEVNFNLDYAVKFYEELFSLKDRNVSLRLDTQFAPVLIRSDYKNMRLPLAFFDSNDINYPFLSQLSIQELLVRRPHMDRVPLQLRYTLVRVTHKDTDDCYQAVFTPQARISDVVSQLTSYGVRTLYREQNGDLKGEQCLHEIGYYVIELRAHELPSMVYC